MKEPAKAAEMNHGHDVDIRGARKRYGHTEALRGIDLRIASGSFTVLLGPSGSGKTTLLRAIAGIERLDEGTIAFGPRVITDAKTNVRPEKRDLAMVFQDYALWPHMTVRQNVAYALRRRHLPSKDAQRRVDKVLDRVGLEHKDRSYPHELSGGQQQRVALARAIVGEPALILFDEPLSNLDADLREHLRLEIATLTRETGATALYITHDQSEAFALADQVGIVNAGAIEQRGTPEEIFRHPASPFVARFTGLAGSLRGTAATLTAGEVTVKVGDHHLIASANPNVTVGKTVDVMVRPTATKLIDPNTREASERGPSIPAMIIDIAYRGLGYDHIVKTPYGLLASVFDERAHNRGDSCTIAIDPAGAIAFPAP